MLADKPLSYLSRLPDIKDYKMRLQEQRQQQILMGAQLESISEVSSEQRTSILS